MEDNGQNVHVFPHLVLSPNVEKMYPNLCWPGHGRPRIKDMSNERLCALHSKLIEKHQDIWRRLQVGHISEEENMIIKNENDHTTWWIQTIGFILKYRNVPKEAYRYDYIISREWFYRKDLAG